MSYIVPNSEPFFFPGGPTGCLLMHGFTAMPEEMLPLGEFLASGGYSVLGMRLVGHATQPADLIRTCWTDWLVNVEDGLAFLQKICPQVVLIGQSMGGMIALTAASLYPVSAVIAMSTPYHPSMGKKPPAQSQRPVAEMIRKRVKRFPKAHPLHHRRELNYPAYPEFPSSIRSELSQLGTAMVAALPQVQVPALLIHSRADKSVPFACLQGIYDHLGSTDKEMLALDGMNHALTRDPNRQVVFEVVAEFLLKVGRK
jgi:carboxylesterase